jgi:hypothetical protein
MNLVRDKHSSLLQKSVNYEQKSFTALGPGLPKYVSGDRTKFN